MHPTLHNREFLTMRSNAGYSLMSKRKRFFQVSLASIFVAILIVGCGLGMWPNDIVSALLWVAITAIPTVIAGLIERTLDSKS